jgi:eukaryotic-like serine/threonine-protein kinase
MHRETDGRTDSLREPSEEKPGRDGRTPDYERKLVSAAWAQFELISNSRGIGGSSFDQRTTLRTRGLDSPPAALQVPGYRVLGEIHRGGQGVVYQAIQESTLRKKAIKVLKEGPFADPSERFRFEREIDLLSRLDHPHIVGIHDHGLSAGHAYYVMDYIAGQPLDAYVVGADLTIDQILNLFALICDAVNVAHLRGVIHRDLKPGNIRIDEEGQPRILDFGLAKWVQDAAERSSARGMTITGQFVGSLPWASPEQAGGQSDLLDIRTDVYSLGVILYQLLTGRFPYPVSGRIDDVVRHIVHTSPARPSSIRSDLDRDVEIIVLKCLSKEAEHRYQSAGELARDVRLHLANEPILATPPTTGYRLRKFVRRNRGAVIAATAVALTLIVASAVSVTFGVKEAQQRKAAEIARARALEAEGMAKSRADELEEVAKFQEAQLSGINAQSMGMRLRRDLLAKARAAAESSKLETAQVDARVEELERMIAGSDFTGMALAALNDNFFQPALGAIETEFADQPLVKARLLQTLANTLQQLGLLDQATAPQDESLAIRRRELGDEHVDTLSSVHDMGVLLQAQGKLAEAESYWRESMEKSRRILGDDDILTLNSIDNMGYLLMAQGKLTEAELYCREALEGKRRVLGDEHTETIISICNYGALLKEQGKLSEAEPYYREALDKGRRILGEEHPKTLSFINNMGLLLQTQGKLAEAEPYYREALEKRRRVLGEEHPNTLTSINNMGFLLLAQNKLAETEPYFREALEKRRRILGEDHPSTLTSINNLGELLRMQAKLVEAEPYVREALEKRRRVLGDVHPETITSINNMGFFFRSQGQYTLAEPYYREALEKRRQVLGEEHHETLSTMGNLAYVLQYQERFDEAEELFRRVLAIRQRVLGDEHASTLIAMNNLGMLLKDAGKLNESEEFLREVLETRRRVLGDEHSDTLTSANNMGALRQAQGNLADAERFCREAVEKRRRVLGDQHLLTLFSICNLGSLLQKQGRPRDAIELLAPIEPAVRESFTADNMTRLALFFSTLGRAHVSLGEYEAAKANLDESDAVLNEAAGVSARDRHEVLIGFVELYDAWHAAEPDQGYDSKAAEWRRKLTAATQPPSTP